MSPSSSPRSTTSTTSGPTPRGGRYAKDDDWTRHRERITKLYITENKTLKDVMAIMEEKYDFVATERMYKARFKMWDVGKNVTAAAVHKLINKVEQHQKGGPCSAAARKTTEIDVGEELDVKRIQKYMKRKPVGLKKLRADPKRPLDVIKALSVDTGKSRSGRAKISMPTLRLDYQQAQPQFQMMSSPPDLMMPWSPRESRIIEEGLPDEMTRLIQIVIDQEFNMSYAFGGSALPLSPAPSSPWQSMHPGHSQLLASAPSSPVDHFQAPDQLMLDFVLKFRMAHILLDDGLTAQAFQIVNMCLNILSTRLQQTQGSDSGASGTVMLYALTAALEMATCFNHLDILHMLFQHITVVCAGEQPRMAEIARRMPQLDHIQQISTLKFARMMMSRAAVGYSGRESPGYAVYSSTVDIAIGHQISEEKLRQLQTLLADPTVQSHPFMAVWMEERISLGVCDTSLANQQQNFWNSGRTSIVGGFPVWTQGDKIATVLRHASDRIDWHKMAGNWATAERWASDVALLSEIVRGYDDELSRKFRADMESVRSPMLDQSVHSDMESDGEVTSEVVSGAMGVSLPPLQSLQASMSLPEIKGFRHETEQPVMSPSWDQHTQGHFPDTTLPSLWNAMGGLMGGMSGVGLHDNSAA
ncbi:hypothetical protein N0V93_004013 [Gnomoniopsis smithogilvyi]|uniref:Clr5 domain-containing protein n=1 Tax=Gnomoniopsis smithogilvyi TaxID=1191159 RepID=A0A9W8YZR4_9PEZI|nr:hypothetical protein N0V93_004013 [Gnomoniopsis smithogilvyi]